ncbi:MAG: hypothetical protein IPO21_04800 [Bacteroidales bacterium]|nr:hypothetical protein [Bacteroidales bacterium]
MKAIIKEEYTKNNFRYVLLVGDHEHIPAIFIAYRHVLKLLILTLMGEDSYPEIAIGRFSGKTAEDIKIQADKVLKYEKLSVSESKSYNRYLMVGSEEGPGDDAELDYEHLINIKNKLRTVSYKAGHELYDGSHGSEDKVGDPTNIDFANAINSELGLLMYAGHGTTNSLTTTNFSIPNISLLKNKTLPCGIFAGCELEILTTKIV